MTFFNKIGNNFFTGITHLYKSSDGKTVQRQAQTESAGLISYKGVDSTQRADLDNINLYASMGVNISKTPATTEKIIADVALQEFGTTFTGNYTLTNTKDANYDLADYRAKLNPEKFAAEYVDPEVVGAHVQDKTSPFAELFG